MDHVRVVLDRHREAIKARYRALGTGIGRRSSRDPTLVVVVYLQSEKDRPSGPQFIEDVPLKFEVTGTIHLL